MSCRDRIASVGTATVPHYSLCLVSKGLACTLPFSMQLHRIHQVRILFISILITIQAHYRSLTGTGEVL